MDQHAHSKKFLWICRFFSLYFADVGAGVAMKPAPTEQGYSSEIACIYAVHTASFSVAVAFLASAGYSRTRQGICMNVWLDRVFAAPAIGMMLEPWFLGEQDYVVALRSVFEEWRSKGRFGQVTAQGPLGIRVSTNDGFTFTFTPDNLVAQFQYPSEIRGDAGKVPQLITTVEIRRYTELLADLRAETAVVLAAVLGKKDRHLVRFGLVAQAEIDGDNPPPGVQKFMAHVAGYWNGTLEASNTSLLIRFPGEEPAIQDQCHHKLEFDKNPGARMKLSLDWQRVTAPGHTNTINTRSIPGVLDSNAAAAIAYFERFGEGSVGDV